jgi:hypothetical protein
MPMERKNLWRMERASWLGIIVVGLSLASIRAIAEVDFAAEVRPILSDHCFACHGPDEGQRKAKLRLDTMEGALGDHGGYPVVVAGDADKSELMVRVTTDDETELMPPPKFGKPLKPEQVEVLRRWIAEGAVWEEHWAFQPVTFPEVPAVEGLGVVRNPIDSFVQARLKKDGLRASPEAEREVLIRRVTFDLTGLPPTPAEVEAFLTDESEQAYEKVVDRLLGSPRYGEHMARHWLDLARYGDTHGLHLDNYREMWAYRDWVVRAFNQNEAFDQFIIDQLAGDLLENPTEDQMIATGFNRCNVTTAEGGSIEEEVYVRNVVDRVVTTGTVFMGLTMDCTRCHDHKFDPLTMKDFYSSFAYFNSLDGPPLDGNRKDPAPVIEVPTVEQREGRVRLTKAIADLEAKLGGEWPEVDALQVAWEESLRAELADEAGLLTVKQFSAETLEAEYLEAEKLEADYLSTGGLEVEQFKADRFEARGVTARGVKAEVVRLKGSGGGEEPAGSAAIALGDWYSVGPFKDVERYLKSRSHGPEGRDVDLEEEFEMSTGDKLKWKRRTDYVDGKVHQDLPGEMSANFLYRKIISPREQTLTLSLGSDDGIRVYLNNKRLLSKMVGRGAAADQEILEVPLEAGENHLLIKILNFGGGSGYYFAIKTEVQTMPEAVYQLAMDPGAERSEEQQSQLRAYYRNQVTQHEGVLAAKGSLDGARNELNELNRQVATTLVFRERKEPKEAFILNRGEYDQHGDKVDRQTPGILPPMKPDMPNNRLGYAMWLVDADHPLTSRVTVNRLWQQLFGTGLVKTSEDFGSQGEPPSHPKLLDWMSAQFMADGWDLKQTMKRMVMSGTYRQSSKVWPEIWRKDRENRLLARGPRLRLDAEMLRDQALYVSGLLNETMGGPSVKPPQPDGLWFAVGYSGSNTVRFKADEGDEKVHRRTLYTFIKRTSPPPQMSTFDGPSRESCTSRRERTNTPMQALLLLNDPQYVEAARGLAQRVMREVDSTDGDRAARMFHLATGRAPCDGEVQDLMQVLEEEREHYAANPDAAGELVKVGSVPLLEGVDTVQLAAWTMTANLVLNLDEVIMKN